MKIAKRLTALLAALIIIIGCTAFCFAASGPTDEILYYGITADVQDDAKVRLTYHFKWKVLRDDIGKLEWVTIGIPNDNIEDTAYNLSDNIDKLNTNYSDGYFLDIYFKNSYKAGDVVDFQYTIIADYMYQMNQDTGITAYFFTPGWFDDIAVDELEIKWNADKVDSFDTYGQPSLVKDGYYTINTSLNPGETYTFRVNYPNDAYQFDADKYVAEWNGGNWDDGDYYYDDNPFDAILGGVVFFGFIGLVVKGISSSVYKSGAGFADGKTETKITRTKIIYFDECPGCGAPREEGKTTCPYCGRDLVKSEEVIKEETVAKEDKEALKYKKDGEYRYSSSPNTYVRVNVVHVPVTPRPSSGRSSGGSHRSGGCVHSSCACACASCACACACACAGGGRAGCTTKDFYNTNLKLKQFELKKK